MTKRRSFLAALGSVPLLGLNVGSAQTTSSSTPPMLGMMGQLQVL